MSKIYFVAALGLLFTLYTGLVYVLGRTHGSNEQRFKNQVVRFEEATNLPHFELTGSGDPFLEYLQNLRKSSNQNNTNGG